MQVAMRCSSLDLLRQCPASAGNDGLLTCHSDPSAALGTAFHAGIAQHIQGQPVGFATLARRFGVDVDELSMLLRMGFQEWGQLRESFPDPEVEIEMTRTDGALTLTGHADLLSVVGNELRIGDWKTGYRSDSEHGWQLFGYAALGLERHPECDSVRVCVIRVREGVAEWGDEPYSRADVLDWWAEVQAKLAEGERFNPGRHCGFCPRALTCEARQLHLQRSLAVLRAAEGIRLAELLDERKGPVCAKLLDGIKAVEKVCDEAREAVRAEVVLAGGTLAIGDGRELVIEQQERRSIVANQESATILAEFIPEADRWGTIEIKKGAVEKAVRAAAEPRKGAETLREMYSLLESAGAMQTTFQEILKVAPAVQHQLESHE